MAGFYSSAVCETYPLIDDAKASELAEQGDPVIDGEQMSRGLKVRPPSAAYGKNGFMAKYPANRIISDRSVWKKILQARTEANATNAERADAVGLGVLNQNGTNYCWGNAPTQAVHYLRLKQGQPLVKLSPGSVCAVIKKGANVGGWGTQALKFGIEHGWVPQDKWPANERNLSKYNTAENNELRQWYRVKEWWDCQPRKFDLLATLLLLGVTGPIGLNWWGHEVLAIDLVLMPDGSWGVLIDNSWGKKWGKNGRSILPESKATPDDLVAPLVAIPSDPQDIVRSLAA